MDTESKTQASILSHIPVEPPAVSIQQVCFAYRNYSYTLPETGSSQFSAPILQNISFTLKKGEKLLILGPPDSGKTTLARILCGFAPRFFAGALKGHIAINGYNPQEIPPYNLMDTISYMAQDSNEELVASTCRDEIVFPLESLGRIHADMEKILADVSRAWNLEELLDTPGTELSGGERRRLLCAVAQAVDAPVLVLDEPFTDLDAFWRMKLMDFLANPSRTAIVFASRPLDIFSGSFTRWAYLEAGCIHEDSEERVRTRIEELEAGSLRHFVVPPPHSELSLAQPQILSAHDVVVHHESAHRSQSFILSIPRFSVAQGETVALLGANGAGKSTFCRSLCGLQPLESGQVLYGTGQGTALAALQPIIQNYRVSYMFQNPDHQIFLPTVREELAWSLKKEGISATRQEKLVTDACHYFQLEAEATPATMGYGARKRLQAAVCWLLDRPFVLLDEPDAALSFAEAQALVRMFQAQQAGIVLVSHDAAFVRSVCSRAYRIEEGVLQEVSL